MSNNVVVNPSLDTFKSLKSVSIGFGDYVFKQLELWRHAGLKSALITLVNIEGSSPRPLGSQLAVNELGEYYGLISGGCLESALVSEAVLCIREKTSKCLRFGRDSDFFDIQLPCGSGIDVHIHPLGKADTWLEKALKFQLSRTVFSWTVDLLHGINVVGLSSDVKNLERKSLQMSRRDMDRTFNKFEKIFQPQHKIIAVGDGEVFRAFERVAQTMDVELLVLEPNQSRSFLSDGSVLDRWTNLVLLSHEHSWEVELLSEALTSKLGFITVLGSKNTHHRRLNALKRLGLSDACLARVKGPAGMDISARTPNEIAISICAELISVARGT